MYNEIHPEMYFEANQQGGNIYLYFLEKFIRKNLNKKK